MSDQSDLPYIRHTLSVLTEQVQKLASAMERLATMEERSISLTRRIEVCETRLEKQEEKFEERIERLEGRQSDTSAGLLKLLAVAGAITTVLAVIFGPQVPKIMTMIFVGAGP